MWLPAFESIARNAHMRLLVLGKTNCPASLVAVSGPPGTGPSGSPYNACDRWHSWAVKTIKRLSPSILVVSQASYYETPGRKEFTASQWRRGLTNLFEKVGVPNVKKVFLVNIPWLSQPGPTCLSAHLDDPLACSTPVALRRTYVLIRLSSRLRSPFTSGTSIRRRGSVQACARPKIGRYDVYMDQVHVSADLRNVFEQCVGAGFVGSNSSTYSLRASGFDQRSEADQRRDFVRGNFPRRGRSPRQLVT